MSYFNELLIFHLLLNGSTRISSRTLRASSISFLFTHCIPKF